MIKQTETNSVNYLKIWLNHFCTSLLPVSSSLLPVYFQFVPVFFQSTATATSFYEVWANYDGFGQYIPFWLIRLKPYCLQERKILIDIVYYSLCTVEKTKKLSSKLKQRVWTTSKFGWTTFVPVSFQLLPVYFQSTSSLFQSTSNPLPVFIQTPAIFQEYIFVSIFFFLWSVG